VTNDRRQPTNPKGLWPFLTEAPALDIAVRDDGSRYQLISSRSLRGVAKYLDQVSSRLETAHWPVRVQLVLPIGCGKSSVLAKLLAGLHDAQYTCVWWEQSPLRIDGAGYFPRHDLLDSERAALGDRTPRSVVVASACLALGRADGFGSLDVLTRYPTSAPPGSASICAVTWRISLHQLCERLRQLAQIIRAVLLTARIQHARQLALPACESSAAPLYLLLLAVCQRYGRRAEPSGAHPSLTRFQPSAGSNPAVC
jgi:hypothetical protein